MNQSTISSGKDIDDWLESKPPWASDIASPLIPSMSQSLQRKLEDQKGGAAASNFSLISELLRASSNLGFKEITFDPMEKHGVRLGEGTTYKVQQRRLREGHKNSQFTWVATKRAKFTVPKATEEKNPPSAAIDKRLRSVLLEIEVLSHPPLRCHPNIPELLGYAWDEDSSGYAPMLVMELATFGCLNVLLLQESLSNNELKAICADVACGLEAVHASLVIHGDVKQENVLIFPFSQRRFIAKISDFENALLDYSEPRYGGTPVYNAPEIQMQRRGRVNEESSVHLPVHQLASCDVFSYGLLAFEILSHGKRYYESSATETFRRALMQDPSGLFDTLEMANSFAIATKWLVRDVEDICRAVFQQTLEHNSLKRLPEGWNGIKKVLGECFRIDENMKPLLGRGPETVNHYSILAFSFQNFSDRDILGRKVWNEVLFKTSNSCAGEHKGKACFELFLLCTLGRYSPPLGEYEAFNWLAASALYGYHGAFLIGQRVFAANSLPIPQVILDGPKCNILKRKLQLLERLPSDEFYANAVRIFWTEELRVLAPGFLRLRKRFQTDDCLRDQAAKLAGLTDQDIRQHAHNSLLLHQAILEEDEQVIDALVEAGCDVDLQTSEGLTPLHLACRIASIPLIRLLLSHKADASINDSVNVSPLHWIILLPPEEIPQIVGLLLQNGALINSHIPVNVALHFDTLGLSLFETPLTWACSCRNSCAVKVLLSHGAHVRSKYCYDKSFGSLDFVLGLVCTDILEIFITTSDGLSDLAPQEAERLWNHIGVGVPNDFQRWCVHGEFHENAYPRMIDALDRAGLVFPIHPCSTVRDSDFYTPLGRAAVSFNVILVREYLDKGANVNDRDWRHGSTALTQALLACSASVASPSKVLRTIELLIDRGASLEPENNPSNELRAARGALKDACAVQAPVAVVRLLAGRVRSSMNEKHRGHTALHLVARLAYEEDAHEYVRILLDHGADPEIETDHVNVGMECCLTAVAEALTGGCWQVAEMLLDRGCSTNFGILGGHKHTLSHLIIYRGFKIQSRRCDGDDKAVESIFEMFLNHSVARRRNLVNEVNFQGLSPIAFAVLFGVIHCAKVLVEHGCITELPDTGKSVLDLLDHYLEYPPSFVVDEKAAAESQLEYLDVPLSSHPDYCRRLIAIRKLLAPNEDAFQPRKSVTEH